ncbi:hypothetical protein AAG906_003931 [Vitis piasezkii]
MIECSVCHSRLVSPSAKTVSRAYDWIMSKISLKHCTLNVFLVVGDCILVGLQPILMFMSKVDGKFEFNPISVSESWRETLILVSVFVQAARNNVLLVVPALLYAINNYLKFIMQLYFNPTTVKMLSNLKVLVIVVLLKIIMRRHFSMIQTTLTYTNGQGKMHWVSKGAPEHILNLAHNNSEIERKVHAVIDKSADRGCDIL